MAKKKKVETVEDILDRIQEDIDLIREKCVCNGDEDYSSEESDNDSFDDEDEEWLSDDDEDKE
jgi:excinuclease UvrABC helicase subunit UvrB